MNVDTVKRETISSPQSNTLSVYVGKDFRLRKDNIKTKNIKEKRVTKKTKLIVYNK